MLDTRLVIGQCALVPTEISELTATRSFAWGVLVVGDAESHDIPPLEPLRTIAATDSTVVIRVRHAQDVTDIEDSEFLVNLRVAADSGHGEGVVATVAVPSGRLSVGDANAADIVNLRPGRWRLRIEVEPDDVPERVAVWLSPDAP